MGRLWPRLECCENIYYWVDDKMFVEQRNNIVLRQDNRWHDVIMSGLCILLLLLTMYVMSKSSTPILPNGVRILIPKLHLCLIFRHLSSSCAIVIRQKSSTMACERQRVVWEIYVVYVKIQKRGLTWKGIFEDKINAGTQERHRRCDGRKYKQLAAFFFL